MVDILALFPQHEQGVLSADDTALESGVPTKTHVLTDAHRVRKARSTNRASGSKPRTHHFKLIVIAFLHAYEHILLHGDTVGNTMANLYHMRGFMLAVLAVSANTLGAWAADTPISD